METMTDDCLCHWAPVMVSTEVSVSGCDWARDVPNSACPVHFTRCARCGGRGREPADQHTQVLMDRLNGGQDPQAGLPAGEGR